MTELDEFNLQSERLLLSPFLARDQEDVFRYASDPRVAKTVSWESHKSIDDSIAFIKFVNAKTSAEDGRVFLPLAIRRIQDRKAVGSISFSQLSEISGQIDYALSVDLWNRGLITEAATTVVQWAFNEFPAIVRIQAFCLVENTGSRRVMEKVGMRYEGIKRSAMVVKGNIVDLATYAVIRSDLPIE